MSRRSSSAALIAALMLGGCVLASPSLGRVAPPPARLDARTVVFASASGTLIHAWLSRGRPGGGAVLLLHGAGANRESMLGRARIPSRRRVHGARA